MSDEPRDPGLEDIFTLAVETALASARVMLPGRVVSYDAVKQSASIQLLLKESHLAEDDTVTVEAVAELQDVPVRHIGGATGRITVPVVKGDTGMVIFASSSIARWKLIGGLIDPGDARKHHISDCVFEPGLHDFAHVPTTAPTDAIVTHGETRVGGPVGTEKMLRAESYRTAEDALINAMTVAFNAIQIYAVAIKPVADPSNAATPALVTAMTTTWTAAVAAFTGAAATYLAQKGRVL